jgi:DNA-binding NarL/FixJ family response regulator
MKYENLPFPRFLITFERPNIHQTGPVDYLSFTMINGINQLNAVKFIKQTRNDMKKVLFAEDHSIVIMGMNLIFQTEFSDYQLDIVSHTPDLMKAIKKDKYELAIIDLQLEDGDTFHLIADIRKLYPDLNVLVFSSHPEELYAQKLFNEGVKGYLNKQTKNTEIIHALRQLLEGKAYMSDNFKKFLLLKENPDFENPFETLSQREREVLNLLIKGKRSSQICKELNLQKSTVATYKAKLFSKLKVDNVLELKKLVGNWYIEFS